MGAGLRDSAEQVGGELARPHDRTACGATHQAPAVGHRDDIRGEHVHQLLDVAGVERRHEPLDDSFVLGFNAHDDDVDFALPAEEYSKFWDVLVDTADQANTEEPLKAGSVLKLAAKSMVVLRAHSGPEVEVDYSAAASLASMAEHEEAHEEMMEAQDEAAAAVEKASAK